jgi:predicted ATPase
LAWTVFHGRLSGYAVGTTCWREALDGTSVATYRGVDGRVVLLSGEAGIGKSRIARALQECLGEQPHTRLLSFCSPHHQASALYPFISQLERAAGFERDDSALLKLDKLEALLAQSSQAVAHDAALMAALLSIPTEGRYPPAPELSPRGARRRPSRPCWRSSAVWRRSGPC